MPAAGACVAVLQRTHPGASSTSSTTCAATARWRRQGEGCPTPAQNSLHPRRRRRRPPTVTRTTPPPPRGLAAAAVTEAMTLESRCCQRAWTLRRTRRPRVRRRRRPRPGRRGRRSCPPQPTRTHTTTPTTTPTAQPPRPAGLAVGRRMPACGTPCGRHRWGVRRGTCTATAAATHSTHRRGQPQRHHPERAAAPLPACTRGMARPPLPCVLCVVVASARRIRGGWRVRSLGPAAPVLLVRGRPAQPSARTRTHSLGLGCVAMERQLPPARARWGRMVTRRDRGPASAAGPAAGPGAELEAAPPLKRRRHRFGGSGGSESKCVCVCVVYMCVAMHGVTSTAAAAEHKLSNSQYIKRFHRPHCAHARRPIARRACVVQLQH